MTIKQMYLMLRLLTVFALFMVIAAWAGFHFNSPNIGYGAATLVILAFVAIKAVCMRIDDRENYEYTQQAYGRRMNRDAPARRNG